MTTIDWPAVAATVTGVAGVGLLGAGARRDALRRNRLTLHEDIAVVDAATGLPNDVGLLMALTERLDDEVDVSLLWLRLNEFKSIENRYGNDADRVIITLRDRLLDLTAELDLVARWDECTFAILIPETDPTEAQHVARDLRELMSEPQQVAGHWICAWTSVGIAVADPAAAVEESVWRAIEAEVAARKGSGVAVWSPLQSAAVVA